MSKPIFEFPTDFVEVEDQFPQEIEESLDATRLATVRVQLQRKDLNNYEEKMRSHAERCVAGR